MHHFMGEIDLHTDKDKSLILLPRTQVPAIQARYNVQRFYRSSLLSHKIYRKTNLVTKKKTKKKNFFFSILLQFIGPS